ncbi:MAG: hypothetical protein GEU90_20530 [Gemmatimonas sp.]|nr:hypothetical protein [Gemmatimonas sp.]
MAFARLAPAPPGRASGRALHGRSADEELGLAGVLSVVEQLEGDLGAVNRALQDLERLAKKDLSHR